MKLLLCIWKYNASTMVSIAVLKQVSASISYILLIDGLVLLCFISDLCNIIYKKDCFKLYINRVCTVWHCIKAYLGIVFDAWACTQFYSCMWRSQCCCDSFEHMDYCHIRWYLRRTRIKLLLHVHAFTYGRSLSYMWLYGDILYIRNTTTMWIGQFKCLGVTHDWWPWIWYYWIPWLQCSPMHVTVPCSSYPVLHSQTKEPGWLWQMWSQGIYLMHSSMSSKEKIMKEN